MNEFPATQFPKACITCGIPVLGASRCPKHRGKAWANRPKRNHGAYSGDWPQIRAQVLRRDWYRCQIQGPGCDGHGVEADHIVAVSEGGSNDLDNLRSACVPCHRRRTGQQGHQAMKRAAAQRRQGR